MRIGLYTNRLSPTVEDAVEQARRAVTAGFGAAWYPQLAGLDALTVLALVAREAPDLHLGTAVVPIQGRFTLGLGVTHPALSEGWFGVPYRGIVEHCAEVLEALEALLSGDRRAESSAGTSRPGCTTRQRPPAGRRRG